MIDRIIGFLIVLSFGALAQSINLTGTVTNASNTQPLQGVVVTLKNTPAMIDTTKADGTYQLSGAVAVTYNLSGVESFSGNRLNNGILEISVTKQEPVTVETFSLNGVLRERLVHDIMAPGIHKVNIRSSYTNADLCLIKVRQGNKTTVYPFLPMRSSFTNNTTANRQSAGLAKSESFNDTLVFTMSGFTTKKMEIGASTGVNDIALQPLQAQTVTIGQTYEGGIVIYILQPGDPGYAAGEQHGLIAAPHDQSSSAGIRWSNGRYLTIGDTATAIGTGMANTKAVVAAQGPGAYAAYLCDTLSLGGYHDWYLPSKNELDQIYISRSADGAFVGRCDYWSSSEDSSTMAWCRYVNDATQSGDFPNDKSYAFFVRAVRSF